MRSHLTLPARKNLGFQPEGRGFHVLLKTYPARCRHCDTPGLKIQLYLPWVGWVVRGCVSGSLCLWETEYLDLGVHFYGHTCVGTRWWNTLSWGNLGSFRSVLCPNTAACCNWGQLKPSFNTVAKKTEAHFQPAAFKTRHLCGREVRQPDAKNLCYRERSGVRSLLENMTLTISTTFLVSCEREHKNCLLFLKHSPEAPITK